MGLLQSSAANPPWRYQAPTVTRGELISWIEPTALLYSTGSTRVYEDLSGNGNHMYVDNNYWITGSSAAGPDGWHDTSPGGSSPGWLKASGSWQYTQAEQEANGGCSYEFWFFLPQSGSITSASATNVPKQAMGSTYLPALTNYSGSFAAFGSGSVLINDWADPFFWPAMLVLDGLPGGTVGESWLYVDVTTAPQFAGGNMADGRWHLMSYVVDANNNELRIYIDGDLANSGTFNRSGDPNAHYTTPTEFVNYEVTFTAGAINPFNANVNPRSNFWGGTKIYFKPLTDDEANTNWLAQKADYGR